MAVTPEEVRRVAELARLRLGPEEAEALAEQLSAILGHVDALQEVEPDASAGPATDRAALRPDQEGADALAHPVRDLAPEWRDGFFMVPVLESHEPRDDGGDEAR